MCSVNCAGPYLAEGFLHNLCPYFHIVFPQLGVITRTKKKFVEIVDASTHYLIINLRIKEAAVPIYLPVKLADGRMSIKKEKVSS